MEEKKSEFSQFVTLGKECIIRGQYDQAYKSYNQALNHEPDHYLVRNALAEVYFIQKEFLSAADNFWLAAVNEASFINLDLIKNDQIQNPIFLRKRQVAILKAREIIQDYAYKAGLSLFAHRYEDPLKKNTQQALINLFRHQIDPCGYRGYVDADPEMIARVERNVSMIGYRFLKETTHNHLDDFPEEPALEDLLARFKDLF